MRLALLLLPVLLLPPQDPVKLRYGGSPGDSWRVRGEMVLDLELRGGDAMKDGVRKVLDFARFRKLRIRGEGKRRLEKSDGPRVSIHTQFGSAEVDGVHADRPFAYQFDVVGSGAELKGDAVKLLCWKLAMSDREMELTPEGEHRFGDRSQDAWGEALEIGMLAPVRLPAKPVAVGEAWELDWKSRGRQRENGARFYYRLNARLAAIEAKNGRRMARVAFELRGRLEIPEDRKRPEAEIEETTCGFAGAAWIDLETGQFRTSESKGRIGSHLRARDESGQVQELKVELAVESKFEERD